MVNIANIKQYTRQILSDTEITSLLPNKKVYFLHAITTTENPLTTPYIEYQIYDENGEAWAEGKEIATNFYIQVDIFSKSDYSDIEIKVKEKMLNAGFERSSGADLYEPAPVDLYHKAMRFITTL